MKLLQLNLIAVGPFTDTTLDFSGGEHGVHLVYGPNEAGKSSSLRALQSLLYGFHARTTDDFVHAMRSLRVGGEFQATDGTTLRCVRRKGNKDTLLDDLNGEPISEQLLARMLLGVDKDQFQQRFGIDHEQLRAGCDSLRNGEGDLAEALFQAGAGLGDVHRLIDSVREEAAGIYKQRGSGQEIPQAIKRYKEANQELSDCQQLAPEWKQREIELAALVAKRETIDNEIGQITSRLAQLRRIKLALPQIAKRDHLLEITTSLRDVPLLPDDFDTRRIETTQQLADARSRHETAEQTIARLEEELAACPEDWIELQFEAAIENLQQEYGAIAQAEQDRPGLATELAQLDRQSRHLLRELGHAELEPAEAERLHIDKLRRERIGKLTAEQTQAENELRSIDSQLDALADELKQLETRIESGELPSVDELAALVREVQATGDLERQHDETAASIETAHREIDQRTGRLQLWERTVEELVETPVPSEETIRRHEQSLDEANANERAIRDRLAELNESLNSLDGEINSLEQQHEVPTEADLAAARESREAAWQTIRGRWLGEAVDAAAELPSDDPQLAGEFESRSHTADSTGDRLRREAESVAAKANFMASREKLLGQLARFADQHEAAKQSLTAATKAWIECWGESGIEPLSPREMLAWLSEREAIIAAAASLADQAAVEKKLGERIESFRTRLLEALSASGKKSVAEGTSLAALVREAEAWLEAVDRQENEHREARRDSERAVANRQKLTAKSEQLTKTIDQSREAWQREFSKFEIPDATSPTQANGLLDTLDEFFRIHASATDKRARIEGIDARCEAFTAKAVALAKQVAPELAESSAAEITQQLKQRLAPAHKAAAGKEILHEQLETQRQTLNTIAGQIRSLQETIERMCLEAKCNEANELAAVARQSRELCEATAAFSEIETNLVGIGEGMPLAEFLAAADAEDRDQLDAEIDRLQADQQTKQDARDELLKQIASLEQKIQTATGGERAVVAAEAVKGELATIAGHVEDYARLKLAESVLACAMQRYRKRNQGPILERASEFFAALSLGSFSHLEPVWGEGDQPVLVGIRAGSGQQVRIDGMSSGSMDQLYLALRLASLEHHLANRDPLPLVVDDILVHFDDDRSAAALKALAEVSRSTQVIMFTHHAHLVEIARETLDEKTLFVRELDSPLIAKKAKQKSLLS